MALPLAAAEVHVTNLADSGPGSLRDAIILALPGDSIVFDVTGVITLTSGELAIAKNLTIVGPGPSELTINGNNASRVISIAASITANISGLTLQNSGIPGDGLGGGGARNYGTLLLSNCVISGNSAHQGGGFANLGTATLSACSILSNSSGSIGVGGIYNSGTLILSRCIVSGNTGFAGGGIGNAGTMTITQSTISDNRTTHSGGGFINGGALTVEASTISGNSASNTGGAFYNVGTGVLTLINSTLAGNRSGFGGGAINNQGPGSAIALINTTLSGNNGLFPGVILNAGTLVFKNSVVSSHSVGPNCAGYGFVSRGHNVSNDGSCATFLNQTGDMNSTDPLLAAGLEDNGGPTQTIALLTGSPAVNAILVADCTDIDGNPVSTDQRGITRPQGSACDIGAYETVPPGLSVPIDIKPGDAKNTINLKSNGTVLVAILSSGASASSTPFDATTVDPASVTLAGAHVATQGKAATPLTNIQDVNRDGRVDLVLHFKTQDLQLSPDDTEAVLLGETFSGQSIRGVDSIRLVP